MTENDKLAQDGGWVVGGFRLNYRYRYRLSKCSCFGSVTIIGYHNYRYHYRLS